MPIIDPDDLAPFATIDPAKAQAMIEDATAIAYRVAPCLKTATDVDVLAAAKAILRGAVLRWNDSGSGAYTAHQVAVGAVSQSETFDNRQIRRGMFWPSEITDLQDLCKSATDDSGAFSVDTAPSLSGTHAPWCNLYFGATYCSCGADIAGEPIFEG